MVSNRLTLLIRLVQSKHQPFRVEHIPDPDYFTEGRFGGGSSSDLGVHEQLEPDVLSEDEEGGNEDDDDDRHVLYW